jgi:hypothetical protein
MESSTVTVVASASMLSGKSSLMMNSWKHINMVSRSSVATASLADFILVYLRIQQIIPKSEMPLSLICYCSSTLRRVLLACIRNLGGCPCPRCAMPLSRVHLVGTKRDRRDRIKLLRVDDDARRFDVSQARNYIYHHNHAVNSAGVERILKPLSLVPTTVNHHCHCRHAL